jgi:AraC-like DNA-binding protein
MTRLAESPPSVAAALSPWPGPSEAVPPAGRVVFRTADLNQASEAMGRHYSPGRLQVNGREAPLDMRLWVSELPNLALSYIAYGTDVSITAPPQSAYVLCLPVSGNVLVGSPGEWVKASARTGVMISPDRPVYFESWSADCLAITLRLDRAALEGVLSAMLGEPVRRQLRFDLGVDLTAAPVQSLLRTLPLLRAELNRADGTAPDPLITAELSRLVLVSLLAGQPHNYMAQLRAPAVAVAPTHIRRVIDFVRAEPESIGSVADLAQIAMVSVRTLEEGFRRHVGVSPMAYVRQVRLTRVHEELRAADPSQTTVAVVAQRWGFYHYGRFATAYRARYGNAPADTLRQPPSAGLRQLA